MFHAVSFSPAFSPILDTGLSLLGHLSITEPMLKRVSIFGEGPVLVELY